MKVAIIAENYRCVGSSVTAFNEIGNCISHELPWRNLSDFELAETMATSMSEAEFHKYVLKDIFVEKEIENHVTEYMETDGVYVIYDCNTNTHYFFS